MVELIFTEKPAQAEKIAFALGDNVPVKKTLGKAPYYELQHNGKDIIVGCAVGHLYGLKELKKKKKGWTYPVFDVDWIEGHSIRKSQAFSKVYLDALKKLVKKADSFVVACDFDTEGSVIGFNCVRFIAKKKDAKRMKFSTLTKDELVESYENASGHLDFGVVEAGLTRHFLDYFWGISLSRALTLAIKATGSFKLMTAGRVQGPALKVVVEKEKEISKFKPDPYWEIMLDGSVNEEPVVARHKEGRIFDKKRVDAILKTTKNKPASIIAMKEREVKKAPPNPFNLTGLQTEAYSLFGMNPKDTLSVAQDLYTAGYISYPRTSSQKLPASLGLKKLITKIGKQAAYADLCEQLLAKPLQPNEGKKSDSAHPSIFATGEVGKMTDRQAKMYDLIVRRFLATFADDAIRKTVTAEIGVNKELFLAKGTTTKTPGWHVFYGPHVRLKEEVLPPLKEGDTLDKPKITKEDKETTPPKRYSQASLIKEMENLGIGTKATRAAIIDSLYQRNYVVENSVTATKLGMETVRSLEKYCPEILDTKLTHHFEEEMEQIMEQKKNREDVLEEAKVALTKISDHFRKHEKDIGEVLIKASRETEYEINTLADCPKCEKGVIQIRMGRFGKFVACNQYPDCKTTFSLPSMALIKKQDALCKDCGFHTVLAIRAGKRPFTYCLSKECPPKVAWRKEQEAKKAARELTKKTTKKKVRKKATKKASKKTTKKATKKTTKK